MIENGTRLIETAMKPAHSVRPHVMAKPEGSCDSQILLAIWVSQKVTRSRLNQGYWLGFVGIMGMRKLGVVIDIAQKKGNVW